MPARSAIATINNVPKGKEEDGKEASACPMVEAHPGDDSHDQGDGAEPAQPERLGQE
jgi:hypothetical protein